ncbi:TetR/AcrR family transcriptional regulator, partial [Planktotalea sp.]|uniref:TetR/AcrR family transcriptional regulator n=1 Tax=Planktotalea sp. TaxID=2029877 RepID=UPI003296A424
LLFDILDSYLMALRDCMAALALVGLSPRAQLLLFVTETLLAYDGMDAEHKIQTEGIASLEPAKQNILRNYQRDMVRQLSDILGQCAPDLAQDPKRLQATAMSVFGMLNWFYMWQPKADHAARKDYAGLVTGLVMDGAR